MRASSIEYFDEPQYAQAGPVAELHYIPRNPYQWVYFAPSVLVSAISWVAGGIPILTNLSFLILLVVCMLQLAEELLNFSKRFGLGGITLFGGVISWFCYDYMINWFFIDFNSPGAEFPAVIVAKSACLHHLFILFAVMGLHLPVWQRLERLCSNIPEPRSHQLYMGVILLAFVVGLMPYIFFSAEWLPVAIWKDISGGRAGGAGFTVGRTGNVNVSWGAYLAQFQQVGQIGALLAVFYVIVLKPSLVPTILCLGIWLMQSALGFGSGTRGQTAYMVMPALFLIFLKYHSQAAVLFKRFSIKAYVISGLLAFTILVALQIQITYRNRGFSDIQLSEVNTRIEGNFMFSEGLKGMAIIPEQSGFFYNSVPGQGALMAMPDLLWRFVYGPIPRALWPNKPIDPVWKWYNAVVTGRSEDQLEGTTVATGLVGDFYFRCGIAGVIEGGLLFGWFCILGERMLQNSQGKIIQLIASIGFLVFVFRSFRGMTFITLYPLLIGVVFLTIAIRIFSPPPQQN